MYIKNMVCSRCIMSVDQILKNNNLSFSNIRLGEVKLNKVPSAKQLQKFVSDLKAVGFELLDDQRKQQIELIKNLLIQKVQSGNIEDRFTISKFFAGKVHKDYSHLSKLFKEVEGITIDQYFILQKIEKVKEWIVYDELTLSEIAWKLGYSSVAHLSGQFKKITGLTPSEFKSIGISHRSPLDQVTKKHN